MKVVFLTVIPSPYQRELFDALDQVDGLEISVFYYAMLAADREWKPVKLRSYEHVLPGLNFQRIHPTLFLNFRLDSVCVQNADIFVIQDYTSPTAQVVMRRLIRQKRTWCYWGENPATNSRGWLASKLRELMMAPLGKANSIVGIGQRAVDRYEKMFPAVRRLENIPYYCSTQEMEKASQPSGMDRKVRCRTFLFSGQLIDRKGVDVLVSAINVLVLEGLSFRVLLLGSGPHETKYIEMLNPEAKRITKFLGFVEPDRLPVYFRQADVFVLPSRYDGWAVVINEAIAAGLPVITTDQVGAGLDLVSNNEDGYVISVNDSVALAGRMRSLIQDEELFRMFQKKVSHKKTLIRMQNGVKKWTDLFGSLMRARSN